MKRATVILLTAVMFGSVSTSALAAGRHCSKTPRYTLTSVTTYSGPSWNHPGHYRMATRGWLSPTATYYVCLPGGRR